MATIYCQIKREKKTKHIYGKSHSFQTDFLKEKLMIAYSQHANQRQILT
jgi:hypothetical protein